MSGDWLPVLVVLGVGALFGLFLAWRLRGSAVPASDRQMSDDTLRLADLERRRDELYDRLRRSENEADRAVLEDQAARVLRQIDRLSEEIPGAETESGQRAQSAAPVARGGPTGRPMLVGFLGGAAMVTLVSVLIFLALGDAEPDRANGMRPGGAPAAAAAASGAEHPSGPLPADVEERLATLRQRLAADPTDLVARKRLALALLATDQYFEAFQVSNEILEGRPNDPDGLYVQGMVRMTMGQDELALESLDRVLVQYPNHILALAGRGMVFMRQGDREAAVLVWERALEVAGGRHPDLEELLAMARDASGATTAPLSPPPFERPELPAGTEGFGVRVELAAGVSVPRGATLFVFLRRAAEGPPAAVKRVLDPVFPLDILLGPDDAMLGRPLPDSGTISARLDADGSASTRGENDLLAQGPGKLGETIRLVLGE